MGPQGDGPRRARRARGIVPRPHPRRAVRDRAAGECAAFEPLVPARASRRPRARRRRRRRTAAILLEPVQGEGGVPRSRPKRSRQARALADEHGALLILDEVQTGVGRSGAFFAWQPYGVRPDAVTLAKGLANGLPIGALLVSDVAPTGFEPGDHASTFGGNPVSCAAACAVLDDRRRPARPRAGRRRSSRRASRAFGESRARPAARRRARPPRSDRRRRALEHGLVIGSAGEHDAAADTAAHDFSGGGRARPPLLTEVSRDDEVRTAGRDSSARAAAAALHPGRGRGGAAQIGFDTVQATVSRDIAHSAWSRFATRGAARLRAARGRRPPTASTS